MLKNRYRCKGYVTRAGTDLRINLDFIVETGIGLGDVITLAKEQFETVAGMMDGKAGQQILASITEVDDCNPYFEWTPK